MFNEPQQILVVDDESNIRRVLVGGLLRLGYEVHQAANGEEALDFLSSHHIDLLITDLRMPKMNGMDLLRAALKAEPSLVVLVLTAHGTVDNAVEALKAGAFDFLRKPFDKSEIQQIVAKALRTKVLAKQDATGGAPTTHEKAVRYGIIGSGPSVTHLCTLIDRVADTPTTVLVTGESGTGKELVARALHDNSSRAAQAFIKVNCAAMPKNLIESELFGYERGAFTGAVASKPGRFELASGGTLFLDEIGEVPAEMQVKLLRVLQEQEFERVGGVKTLRVDVRLVAATNRDLRQEIAAGNFREDLFYRLHVVPIALPPLRERSEDIAELAAFFIAKFNRRLGKNLKGLDETALAVLQAHRWPGNIRELENAMERAVLFADGETLHAADLPDDLAATAAEPVVGMPGLGDEGLKEQVKAATVQLERRLILRALKQTGGNVTHAARLLQISRKGLQLKMKELDLREKVVG
jgi:two-component system, NtrC family, response regulator AtoC